MSDESKPVRLEEIDWRRLLPVIDVFSSFRMAIHPAILLPSLMLVMLLAAGGKAWDWTTQQFGADRVHPGEIVAYVEFNGENFESWRERQESWATDQLYMFATSIDAVKSVSKGDFHGGRAYELVRQRINENYAAARDIEQKMLEQDIVRGAKADELEFAQRRLRNLDLTRRGHLSRLASLQPAGPFEATSKFALDAAERMASASLQMRWGFDQIRPSGNSALIDRSTVIGAARDIAIILPSWLWTAHRWFLLGFGLFALLVWAWVGGAVARLAAWRIARREWLPMKKAFGYSRDRVVSAVIAPLLPLVLSAVFLAGVWLIGFLAFGLPYVHVVGDVVGGAVYGIVILLSLAAAMCLVGFMLSWGLMLPATASDGADTFDAVERAFGYLIGRPWQVVFYNAAAVFYGAITYLFLSLVVFVTLWIAQGVGGSGSAFLSGKLDSAVEADRFDSIHHAPVPGRLAGDLDWWLSSAPIDWPGKIGSTFVALWVILFVMLLVAYVVGYFICAQTWIYVLVRRSTDGTDVSEIYVESAAVKPAVAAAPAPPVQAPLSAADMPKPEDLGAKP